MRKYFAFTVTAPIEAHTEEQFDDAAMAVMEEMIQVVCQGREVAGEHVCRYDDWGGTWQEVDEED